MLDRRSLSFYMQISKTRPDLAAMNAGLQGLPPRYLKAFCWPPAYAERFDKIEYLAYMYRRGYEAR
jgi:hypothetical protein